MTNTSILIIDAESNLFTMRIALEQRYGITVNHFKDATPGLELVRSSPPDHVLVNPSGIEAEIDELLTQLTQTGKNIPVIAVGSEEVMNDLRSAYAHVVGCVPPSYNESNLLPFLRPGRPAQTGRRRNRALAERAALVQANQLLERRVQEMMTLSQIGKSVASLTDLDAILARIVEAAVFMLRAEESSIMLKDPGTNELFLRSQKGVGEKHARGFNLKIENTLIGSVVRTGKPVRLTRNTTDDPRLKVVTGYMVNALLYVPLELRGQVIGVLGVANQTAPQAFSKHDQRLMEALADYAALAIEVARQHKLIESLRQDSTVAHTITDAIQELRERLATDDAAIVAALQRIEDAAHTLTHLADTEAPVDV